MFGIAWPELLLIGVVAVIAIGPKDLPPLMRQAGKLMRQARAMWAEMQSHFDDLPHQVDLEASQREADEIQKETNAPYLQKADSDEKKDG